MAGPAYHARTHMAGGTDPLIGYVSTDTSIGGDYAEQVLANPALMSYWPLNDASGDAIDYGPEGRDLSPAGTPTYGEPGPFASTADTAMLFNSVDGSTLSNIDHFADDNGYVAPGVYDFDNNDTYTWEVLVYPTSNPAGFGGIVNNWQYPSGATFGIALAMNNDGKVWTYRTSAGIEGPVLPLNEWTHLAATYDGSTLRLYVDGLFYDDLASAGTQVSSSKVRVGYMDNAGGTGTYHTFRGRIAQLAVYNDALSGGTLLDHATAAYNPAVQPAGYVLTADGSGGTSWEPPTIEVTY